MKKLFNDPELDIYSFKLIHNRIMLDPSDFDDEDNSDEGGMELPAV